MPLTKKGSKVLAAMRKTYGKKKGTRVFYAYSNKHRGLHGKRRKSR